MGINQEEADVSGNNEAHIQSMMVMGALIPALAVIIIPICGYYSLKRSEEAITPYETISD